MVHLERVILHPERYPVHDCYPFNLEIYHATPSLDCRSPITFFVGENGCGKSTLLSAIARKCGIYIWKGDERTRYHNNRYEEDLFKFIEVVWACGMVPGSFFASNLFQGFARLLDEWASADPGLLDYFGGKSLMNQSHGQSLLSFFTARFAIRGLYLLDEPETALSPKSQVALLGLLQRFAAMGHAQFIIASHSPILLACPGAMIYSFDRSPVSTVHYHETDYYRIYKQFMENPERFLGDR